MAIWQETRSGAEQPALRFFRSARRDRRADGRPPAEIVSKLAASGATHAYIDGGITIQRFLRAGLIQRLIITRVPVLIGEGIPLFGSLPHDVHLRHISTKHYSSGMVSSEYEITNRR